MTSSKYPEAITYQLRGDLARQVRRVHGRFAPASGGRLTIGAVVARAVDRGLDILVAELLTGCAAASDVRPPAEHGTAPTTTAGEGA